MDSSTWLEKRIKVRVDKGQVICSIDIHRILIEKYHAFSSKRNHTS